MGRRQAFDPSEQAMNWSSPSAFFDMGGYGLYVWGAYAVTGVAMLVEPWLARRRLRQALRDVATQSTRD
jgi:heme exporter protein D